MDDLPARQRIRNRFMENESAVSPRSRVLAAAADCFYLDGIRAVGVDRLIREAEVARASFYGHFRSKNELVLAYLSRWDQAWRSWFVDSVEARGSVPAERLMAVFDVLEDLFRDGEYRGCAFARAVADVGDELDEVGSLAQAHKDAVEAFLSRTAANAGAPDPGALGRELLLLIEGAMVTAARDRSAEAAGVARSMARVIIDSRLGGTGG